MHDCIVAVLGEPGSVHVHVLAGAVAATSAVTIDQCCRYSRSSGVDVDEKSLNLCRIARSPP